MDKEEIATLCKVTIAFSTFIGVGGTFAYYLKQVLSLDPGTIMKIMSVYVLALIVLLRSVRNRKE